MKKKGENRGEKIQKLAAQAPVILDGDREKIKLPPPPNLKNIKDIKREMARVYRGVYRGELTIQQAGSLIFMLDKIVKAIKDQVAVDTVSQAYMQSWTGFSIISPTDADAQMIAPPRQEIIPPSNTEETDDE